MTRTVRFSRRRIVGVLIATLIAGGALAACVSSSGPTPIELTASNIAALDCEATRTVSNELNALYSQRRIPAKEDQLEKWLPEGADFESIRDAVNSRRKDACQAEPTPSASSPVPSSGSTRSPATTVADCTAEFVQVEHKTNPFNRLVPSGIDAKTPEESRDKDFAAMASNAANLALTAKYLGLWGTAGPEGLVRDDGKCLSSAGAVLYSQVVARLAEDGTELSFREAPAKWYNTGIDGDQAIVAEKPGFTGNSKALFYELPDATVVVKLVRSGNLALPPGEEEGITPGATDNSQPKKPSATPTAVARSSSGSKRTSSARQSRATPTSTPYSSPARSASVSPTASVAPSAQPTAAKTPRATVATPRTATTTVVPNTTSTTTIPRPA